MKTKSHKNEMLKLTKEKVVTISDIIKILKILLLEAFLVCPAPHWPQVVTCFSPVSPLPISCFGFSNFSLLLEIIKHVSGDGFVYKVEEIVKIKYSRYKK